LLVLCDSALEPDAQNDLSELLARSAEADLDAAGRSRLDQLLESYRRGLILKARAWKEAVARGLKPPVGANGS
jgi:hypothetical protein